MNATKRKHHLPSKRALLHLLPLGSTVLLAASSMDYRLSWLSLVALLPYLAYTTRFAALHPRRFFWMTWLMGWLFIGLNISWLLRLHPEIWTTITGPLSEGFTIFAWTYSTTTMSLAFVLLALLIRWSRRYDLNRLNNAAFFAGAWVLCEFVRSWIFSLIYWAENATYGPHWNFGNLGMAGAPTPLAFIGRYAGLFGLSLAVVAFNLAIFWALNRHYRRALLTIAVLALVAGGGYLHYRPGDTRRLDVGYLHLNSQDPYAQTLVSRARDAAEFGQPKVDLFVLPEYSYFFNKVNDEERQQFLQDVLDEDSALISAGWEDGNELSYLRYNRVLFRNRQDHIIADQPKSFLIPAGEYLPGVAEVILKATDNEQLITTFSARRGVDKGPDSARPVKVAGIRVGALACSGMTTPYFYRALANDGAEVLVNTSSLNIFKDAPLFYEQNRQMLMFQAVANARPFVQAAKEAPSYTVTADGRYIAHDKVGTTNVTTVSVQPNTERTLYSRLGEWVPWLAGLLVLLGLLPARLKTRFGSGRQR